MTDSYRNYSKLSPLESAKMATRNPEFPWVKRAKECDRLISDYLERYTATSKLWMEAVSEGWSRELLAYIRAVAFVQAQIIAGCINIGFSSMDIFGINNQTPRKEVNRWIEEQNRLAAHSMIDVAVPTARILEFKEYSKKGA